MLASSAMMRRTCRHVNVVLYNSDFNPRLQCTTCSSSWTYEDLHPDRPIVVATDVCLMCERPVAASNVTCSIHELRAAAVDCVRWGDDQRLFRAALRYTADVIQATPLAATRDVASALRMIVYMLRSIAYNAG